MDFDAAHVRPDPVGYGIEHDDELVLIRLADGEEIGRFTDRDELDAAAELDRAAYVPVSPSSGWA